MLLGIEIGGTKLQLGVSPGEAAAFADFRKLPVDPARGAPGIRAQIASVGRELVQRHQVKRVGFGFGGPVDALHGITTKSHQIDGWESFGLGDWCQRELGVPAVLGNDCDAAALAEARLGAGQGKSHVFYVTVGTGVGGGFVLNGQLLGRQRPAIAEIGHLRPGIEATSDRQTVESIASGPGIVATARTLLQRVDSPLQVESQRLREACGGEWDQLTAVIVAEAARQGNTIAMRALDRAVHTLGWAIAQVITLLAPEVVVVGGGVSQIGEELFFRPLRAYTSQYVFPPLEGTYRLLPAALGEEVVVRGAIALAAAAPC